MLTGTASSEGSLYLEECIAPFLCRRHIFNVEDTMTLRFRGIACGKVSKIRILLKLFIFNVEDTMTLRFRGIACGKVSKIRFLLKLLGLYVVLNG